MSETLERAEAPSRPATPYDLLGGAAGLRRLVEAFYRIMDTDAQAAGIRALHGPDLAPVAESLFEWLSGWLGGPALYIERKGSPCLIGPHRAVAIGPAERDQWLYCMRRAFDEIGTDPELRRLLDLPLGRLAEMVRNR